MRKEGQENPYQGRIPRWLVRRKYLGRGNNTVGSYFDYKHGTERKKGF